MKARLLILLLLLWPIAAHANPVSINGQSVLAFGIVAFWALVIEAGLATLALVSRGVLIVPFFIVLVVANLAVFLFAFLPLTNDISLWILEPGIVAVDAFVIMLLASSSLLQGGTFAGVSWRRALAASLLGNAASFFVGVIASGAPWVEPMTG